MKQFTNLLLIFSILALIGTCFLIHGCTPKPKPAPAPIISNQDEESQSETSQGKDVYVTDNINDENVSKVTESSNTVSYWYISYHASLKKDDNMFDGYKVVSIDVPYYDVYKIRKAAVPYVKDEDYVGINFFKRVPFETYKAYLDEKVKQSVKNK